MSRHRASTVVALTAALALFAVACVPAPLPWTSDSPSGSLDEVTVADDGAVTLRGWAGDRNTAEPLDVVFFAGGRVIGAVAANVDRPDVVASTSRDGRFGFTTTLSAAGVRVGTPVCASAVNIGPGSHSVIGCRAAASAAPAPGPGPVPGPAPEPPTTGSPPRDPRLDQVQELNSGPGAIGCPGEIVPGQTFTAGRSGALEQIDVLVSSQGRVRITIELRATVSGKPDGEPLATASIDADVGRDPAWVSAAFDEPVAVIDGVQYGYTIRASDDCTHDVLVFGDGRDPYPGGIHWISFVDDRSVLVDDETVDLSFRTYVAEVG